ncbi:flavodoxin family protein [Nocardioides aestuarii]|uniref:Flavodoxin family protein n=1 Tax=Nocardioides aestuarii TaxID=252231 RepID=A0ABW4TVP5_9ACTN
MTARPRALVVHESWFGNTARLAAAVADGLRSDGYVVEVCHVDRAPTVATIDVDLLVVGAPTHAFSLSRPSTRVEAVRQGGDASGSGGGVREWLEAGRGSARAVPTVCFDTRADRARHLPGSAARKAARLARDAGLEPSRVTESFYVADVAGPLLPGELSRAARWGRRLAPQPTGSR